MVLLAAEFISWRGMGWNLFLALLPLVLAILLFRRRPQSNLLLWLGLVPFLLLLPNAAYVLTDIVQLVRQVRQTPYLPTRTITLVLLPEYSLFMLAGFQAHVLSVTRLGEYCRAHWGERTQIPVEIAVNFLVAVGIYLGRYHRFNSWDVLRNPLGLVGQSWDDLTNPAALWIMGLIFVVVVALFYAMKSLNRGLAARWRVWQAAGSRNLRGGNA